MAIWTGFRREELKLLEWRDVLLDVATPYVQLRAKTTKSDRADVVPLHPQAVAELRAFRPADAKLSDRVLPEVPSMSVMKRDLKFAGIAYGDDEIGFADLHAQRMTLNTMLASQAIDPRVRQAQLRHTDPRLTEVTYFDKSLFLKPQSEKLALAAAIETTSPSIKLVPEATQLMHNGGCPTGLLGSQDGTDQKRESHGSSDQPEGENIPISPDFGTKRHDPAS